MNVSLADGGSGCPGRGAGHSTSTGCGRAFGDPAHARMIAIAEAAERYAAYEPPTAEHRWATVAELEGPVLDTTRLPRCSAAELANPACSITPFDAGSPVRWVQGLDLVTRERTWLPAVMSTYRLHAARPAERFWYQLSTGFAVHTDPVEALVRAILEVIERDAIALTWLQRMPLPPIPAEAHSPRLDQLLAAAERHFLHTLLLDATTDLGVPTVYCVQIAEHDPRARHVVGCAADRTLSAAAEKALAETLSIRGLIYSGTSVPESFEEFADIADGARYLGVPERAEAFDFLHQGIAAGPRRTPPDLPASPQAALDTLLQRLSALDMQVLAVDRSHLELRSVGLTAVNVVIPGLQPMSLLPLAQFRAHPRLYRAPAAMGFPVHSEEELNPWPQPFA
ncbi:MULTISPECIES: YcaO-like family protein [unclassified Streptomyces]|uniref:YcaO-like family protein n=1 Tax=unclassified Streptomyces TaxID=2593676 RepID=UPI002E1A5739|nr:YcaO-like family protein [Streptomyces sp. NBC_01023]